MSKWQRFRFVVVGLSVVLLVSLVVWAQWKKAECRYACDAAGMMYYRGTFGVCRCVPGAAIRIVANQATEGAKAPRTAPPTDPRTDASSTLARPGPKGGPSSQ